MSYHLYGWNVDEYCEGLDEVKNDTLNFSPKIPKQWKFL
jgi:hypothetical protein